MANIFNLKEEFLYLQALAEDETLDQQMIKDTLEGVEFEIEEKADAYARIIRILNGNIATIEGEINRLENRKEILNNNVKSLKYNLENTMRLTGKVKFKTQLFSFGIQKNPPTLKIDKEEEIPKTFFAEQAPVLNKAELRKYLKENHESYAHLEQTESLRIR